MTGPTGGSRGGKKGLISRSWTQKLKQDSCTKEEHDKHREKECVGEKVPPT